MAVTGPAESLAAQARAVAGGPARPWPLNFYRGVSATVLRACCLGATKMACYDQVKEELRRRCGLRDDVPSERYALQGAAAVAAGLAITVATSPATNARVLWMASEPGTFRHLGHALGHIVATRGPGGLFRGFSAQWARFGPYALVHYFAWEQMRLLAGMRPL